MIPPGLQTLELTRFVGDTWGQAAVLVTPPLVGKVAGKLLVCGLALKVTPPAPPGMNPVASSVV